MTSAAPATATDAVPLHPAAQDRIHQQLNVLIETVLDYGIFVLDPQGHVMSWNAGANKLKGYTREEIIGQHFSVFYPPEAVAAQWPQEELRQAQKLGRFEDEGWRIRKDGSRFWANVIITALYEPTGELAGFGKVTRDLTERRQHEQHLRASEERFRLLVGSVRDYAIFMLDPEGHVQSWNAGAHAIKGYAAEEIVGRHFRVFYPPAEREAGKPEEELRAACAEGRVENEGWRLRKDGSLFWANVVVTAVYGADGQLIGFAKITRDMTERRKLEELERSSRRMNEFLAMLAHELRNPLAPIRNAVTIMQLEPSVSVALRNCRDVIDRQLSQVTRLVDDLLDVGRLSTGKIKLRKERVSFAEVVGRGVETARPMIEVRRHSLQLDLPPEPFYVMGDLTRLSQVLQNLLLNAAKYTPDGGHIKLAVTADNGFVIAQVIDNGRGIDAEQLQHIFTLFMQAEDATALGMDSGLGIGLTLARSLVEMHGGTLEAKSPGTGQGSTFTVRLPLAQAPQPSVCEQALQQPPRQGLRVLVVDDNRDAADSVADIFRLLGNEVQTFYDGQQALERCAHFQPDVVLLDLAMPGMDGFETARQLRQQPGMQQARLVALTGFGNEEDKARTREAGFAGHLTKPLELKQLVALLGDLKLH